jgi:hypothetical protein
MYRHENASRSQRRHRAQRTFATSSVEDAIVRHVLAEYRRGGDVSVADALDALDVHDRADPAARLRLLNRSDLVEAIGEEAIARLKETLVPGHDAMGLTNPPGCNGA